MINEKKNTEIFYTTKIDNFNKIIGDLEKANILDNEKICSQLEIINKLTSDKNQFAIVNKQLLNEQNNMND